MPECPIDSRARSIVERRDGSGVYDMSVSIKCKSESCPVLSLKTDEGLALSRDYGRDLDLSTLLFDKFVNGNVLALRGDCVNLLRESKPQEPRRGL